MSPACASATPRTRSSAPASPRSCSTQPAVAGVDVRGGAPGTRETALLDPAHDGRAHRRDRAVGRLGLRPRRRLRRAGLAARAGPRLRRSRDARVPIVPGAILFDLLNGGDKDWGRYPPYRELGYAAAANAARRFRARQRRRRPRRHAPSISRAGSARPRRRRADGITVGALAAVNAAGSVTVGDSAAFLGGAVRAERRIRRPRLAGQSLPPMRLHSAPKARRGENTTLAVVATDATLTKAQANRLAVMAQDGLARAIYPVHTPLDGDVVFAAATGAQAARRSVLSALPSSARSPPTCVARADRARRLRGDRAALPRRAAGLAGQVRHD